MLRFETRIHVTCLGHLWHCDRINATSVIDTHEYVMKWYYQLESNMHTNVIDNRFGLFQKKLFFLGQLSCHLVMLLFCCQCSRWGFCCICCRFVFWVCQSSFEHLMKLQSRALLTSVVKLWHWAARFRDVRKKHVCVHSTLAFSSRQANLPLQLSGHSVLKISRSLLHCTTTQSNPAALLSLAERQQLVSRVTCKLTHQDTWISKQGGEFQNQETVPRKGREGCVRPNWETSSSPSLPFLRQLNPVGGSWNLFEEGWK